MPENTETVVTNTVATPVVLSDKLIDKVDIIQEQARRIGQLEGEKEVFRNNAKIVELQCAEKEAELQKKVIIEINDKSDSRAYGSLTTTASYVDPFTRIIDMLSNGKKGVSVITKNIDCLTDLADAVVKGDAKKEVDAATKRAQGAEKDAKVSRELLDTYQKDAAVDRQNAIEKAEKSNLTKIAGLQNELKIKKAQVELDQEAHRSEKLDLELAVETLDIKNKMLEKQLELLRKSPKHIISKFTNQIRGWYYGRLLRNY